MNRLLLLVLLWTVLPPALTEDLAADGRLNTASRDHFIKDIIRNWNLRLPTIITDEIPDFCFYQERILCLKNEDTVEVALHLKTIHNGRKHDGLIFVTSQMPQVHEKLIRQIDDIVPSIFTSNCPVFMPVEYSNMMKLRLDSNILFCKHMNKTGFELEDKFAIKGGPAITLKLGIWDTDGGIRLKSSVNRWERRKDLRGALLVNCFMENGAWAKFTKDKDGNIIGSSGFMQDQLFFITDGLNLTIRTVPYQLGGKRFDNGSYTAGRGLLQRKEVDVFSPGLGVSLYYCFELGLIDCPFQTAELPAVLWAAIPKGTAPNMWVYVQVFGTTEWTVILVSLLALVLSLAIINVFTTRGGNQQQSKSSSLQSDIASVFLFAIQMGEHAMVGKALRLLTLFMSGLTFLIFVYYCNDITAKMTTGPGENPVKNFEDVLHYDYSVVCVSIYYITILEKAKNGSARQKVYEKHVEGPWQKEKFLDVAPTERLIRSFEKGVNEED